MRPSLLLGITLAGTVGAVLAPSTTQTIQIARRSLLLEDGTLDESTLLRMLHRTLLKYNHPGLSILRGDTVHNKRDGIAKVTLTDQITPKGEDEVYFGQGKVGKTSFTFDFDTGSADLFVPGPDCDKVKDYVTQAHYDNSGQAQKSQKNVTYGSGQVVGENFKDTVSIGGLTAHAQGFISLTNATGFGTSIADGLLGMAFSTIANTKYPTFFETLIQQSSVRNQDLSFYLGHAQSGTQIRSSITLGGRDKTYYYGEMVRCAVTRQYHWQIALDGVKFNSGNVNNAVVKGAAAIDTGTTFVLGLTKAVHEIMAEIPDAAPIPLQKNSAITLYSYPYDLDSKYVPSFAFGGKDLAINPIDFNLGKLDKSSSQLVGLAECQDKPQAKPNGAQGSSTQAVSSGICVAGLAAADISEDDNLYVSFVTCGLLQSYIITSSQTRL